MNTVAEKLSQLEGKSEKELEIRRRDSEKTTTVKVRSRKKYRMLSMIVKMMTRRMTL